MVGQVAGTPHLSWRVKEGSMARPAPSSRSVHCILERLASGELHCLRRLNGDRLASRRIATCALGSVGDREVAEAEELHGVALAQRSGQLLERGIERAAGIGFREVGICSDGGDEFGFVHDETPIKAWKVGAGGRHIDARGRCWRPACPAGLPIVADAPPMHVNEYFVAQHIPIPRPNVNCFLHLP